MKQQIAKLNSKQKIDIFRGLFRGREDVFALRWEKRDKSSSGYTPVCENEWKTDVCIKLNKDKCKNCKNQQYTSLNDHYIEQHLRGYRIYGIYPLLPDNTSYFLAADFDGKSWENDILRFIKKCADYELPIYVERSRSGKGGHAWIFFEDKCPAYISRGIAYHLLNAAQIIDQFDREDSFDRLFPNQDLLSGKGFGNLIALPLQGEARKFDNTVFLDPNGELVPFKDQWRFLLDVKKVSVDRLKALYEQLNKGIIPDKIVVTENLTITVKDHILINKNNLPKILVDFLRENLNFINSEYVIKKRIGLSVHKMEKYFKLVQTVEDHILIPRGFLDQLKTFLEEQDIEYNLVDKRSKFESIHYESEISLHNDQMEAVESLVMSDNGILVAPPGSGKTIIGISLILRLRQPTLILVHKKQIFNQWIDRVEGFLNIPLREIGQLCSIKKTVGKKVTIAMVQTLSKLDDIQNINDRFGMVIVDECHHIPAKMFRNVITKFNPYYLYGLTATPERKHNDEKLIFIYLGEILHTIGGKSGRGLFTQTKTADILKCNPELQIRKTELSVPFKVATDNFQVLSKIISFDSHRNQQIIEDIKNEIEKGSKCLVLTERKEHVEVLDFYLRSKYETIELTGDLTEKQRKIKIKQIEAGDFQILISTGQLIGEGTDFPSLNCLFLVYPFSFSGKLTQYIGRIHRGNKKNKIIYDYRDINIPYLEKLFKKRLRYYNRNLMSLSG